MPHTPCWGAWMQLTAHIGCPKVPGGRAWGCCSFPVYSTCTWGRLWTKLEKALGACYWGPSLRESTGSSHRDGLFGELSRGLKYTKTIRFQVTSRLRGKNSCLLVPCRSIFSSEVSHTNLVSPLGCRTHSLKSFSEETGPWIQERFVGKSTGLS